jgi:putative FmdB family regulatory protein
MPLREYRCLACGQIVEVLQRMDDPPLQICSNCGGQLQKLLSAPALHFKGSGFYVTDYPRGGAAAAGSTDKEKSAEDKASSSKEKSGGDSASSSREKSGADSGSPSPANTPKSDGAKADTTKGPDSKPTPGKPTT